MNKLYQHLYGRCRFMPKRNFAFLKVLGVVAIILGSNFYTSATTTFTTTSEDDSFEITSKKSSNEATNCDDIIPIGETINDLNVQPGKCIAPGNYEIQKNNEIVWYKVIVPLTGTITIDVASTVNVIATAYDVNCTTLQIADKNATTATLELTGLTPCDEIFIEIKSYNFSIGTTFELCAYEPPLECNATFTDSNAGDNNKYKSGESTTTVICPDNDEVNFVKLLFNQFKVEAADEDGVCSDYMEIHDGDSVDAPLIEINGKTRFCDEDLKGEDIYATNWPNGCLTVVFYSDETTNRNGTPTTAAGWSAQVTCDNCNIDFDTEITTCDGTNYDIVVNASGGSGEYEYQLVDASGTVVKPYQTANYFVNVPDAAIAPDFKVLVKDVKDDWCIREKVVTPSNVTPLTVEDLVVYPTDCEGNNGAVVLKVTGGKKPYFFDLEGDNKTGGLVIEELEDDVYKITDLILPLDAVGNPIEGQRWLVIEDATTVKCSERIDFTLTPNCKEIICGAIYEESNITDKIKYFCSESGDNIVLNDLSFLFLSSEDTNIQVFEGQGTAGTLLAEYTNLNRPTADDFPIYSGSACITILLNEGQGDLYDVEFECADCDFTVDIATKNESCMGDDGEATITINGNPDTEYKVTLIGSPNQVWNGIKTGQALKVDALPASTYPWKFYIEDEWTHCIEVVTATIRKEDPVTFTTSTTNATCASNDGEIEVVVSGGSGAYEYSIDAGSSFTTATADEDEDPMTYTFTITGLSGAGDYYNTSKITLVVRDKRFTEKEHKADDCATYVEEVKIGNDCFLKDCTGYFFDSPVDIAAYSADAKPSKSNYADNKTFTAIVCPDEAAKFTTVTFKFLDLAAGDVLTVYDSNGVPKKTKDRTAALIGEYDDVNTTTEFSLTAKNETGCLTFRFKPTNDGITGAGWFGEVKCYGACAMELDGSPTVKPQTCEYSEDGSLTFGVRKGSGNYTYTLYPLEGKALPVDADDEPVFSFNITGELLLADGTYIAPSKVQTSKDKDDKPVPNNNVLDGLTKGDYVYVIEDENFPNCRIEGLATVTRYPPLQAKVKSPGLLCGATKTTIKVLPWGGSGRYFITPFGNQDLGEFVNEGEEFVFELETAIAFTGQIKVSDVANKLECYEEIPVVITPNCRITCYDNEFFSSGSPYDGPKGYKDYEHFEVTYCPHGDDQATKADFSNFLFETEEDLDVLKIYNGTGTTDLIGTFSGTKNPGAIISTAADGCLTFVFESNTFNEGNLVYDGFKAKISCVDCTLSATAEVTGETFCWNPAAGDANGSITIKVDNPKNLRYQFELVNANGMSLAKDGSVRTPPPNFLRDDDEDADKDGVFTFSGLTAADSPYTVRVKEPGTSDCIITIPHLEVEEIEELDIEVQVTNAICGGQGGKVCFTPTNGSGDYSYYYQGMWMDEGCFDAQNGNTISITVRDNKTGCTANPSGIVGSDCEWTCDKDFFDTGDANKRYEANENERWIFCPTHDDKFVQIDFSSFETETGVDILTIIDGNGYGTVIGEYSGSNSPGLVRSTSGCLTVEFKSNEEVQKLGWEAKVSCFYCPKDFAFTGVPTDACGGHNGSIDLGAVATGYNQFIYSLSPDFTDSNTTGKFSDLSGTVTVYAKINDLEACVKSIQIQEALTYTHTTIDAGCGKTNGQLKVEVSGGSGNAELYVNGSKQASLTASDLAAGAYYAEIKDGDCVKRFAFTIYESDDDSPIKLYFKSDHPILGGMASGDVLEVPYDEEIPVLDVSDVIYDDRCAAVDLTFLDELLERGVCATKGYDRYFKCTWSAKDAYGQKAELYIYIKLLCPVVTTSADLTPNYTFSSTIYREGDSKYVIINVNEANGENTSGTVQFFVPKSSGYDLVFEPNLASAQIYAPETVSNTDWSMETKAAGYLFTSTKSIPAYGRSRVALKISSKQAGALANLTVNIVPSDGSDSNNKNNVAVLSISTQN